MESKPNKTWGPAATEVAKEDEKTDTEILTGTISETPINASGHCQELDRIFGLLSTCSVGITCGSTWIALGGSIAVAIYNGGPPGVLYEFIAASVAYWLIAASLAELASAMPSAGGVYHWSSITAGRYGRVCGFFAGWINFLAYLIGTASGAQILGALSVSMYSAFHPDFVTQRWHVFVAFLVVFWISSFLLIFANKALPFLETLGGFLVIACVFVTVAVCVSLAPAHASNSFVWRDWQNSTGYSRDGFVFMLGMLNGAFAVGTPDAVSHLAEEIPRPSKNIPIAILAQFVIGFITTFAYIIAISYSISDLDAVLSNTYLFPLTSFYRQAAGSDAGTLALLLMCFLPLILGIFGAYLTASRMFWTLARDNATPFAKFFAKVDAKHKTPTNAILFCLGSATVLGCIYLGSSTAFNAFVGSFVVLSLLSYLLAILPHLLNRRSGITPGWFWMSGPTGFIVNTISCLLIVVFVVIFCFPFSLPVNAESMNYTSLMTGGLSLFVAAWWVWRRGEFEGPIYVEVDAEVLAPEAGK